MAQREIPWPKKGDKLFVDDSSIEGKAFHLGSIMWSSSQHADAFKEAADMVIEHYAQEQSGPYRDDLLFPVGYLYRHALELKLKEIVRYGVAMHCYDKADIEEILRDHNLAKLWTKARMCIINRWPNGDKRDLSAAEAVIQEMHQADRDGQKWRYATDKDGRSHRHERLPRFVSPATLRATMDNVYSFLAACADGIDSGLQDLQSGMDRS